MTIKQMTYHITSLLFICCLLTLFGSLNVFARSAANCNVIEHLDCSDAAEKGKWQFGVGMGSAFSIPQYIGSDEQRDYLIPVPYISYQGSKLKIGQGGISGKLFNSEHWFLSLSLSGAIPVKSDKNKARRGMDDLEAVFEYGPSLKYFFYGHDESTDATFLDFNFREARTLSLNSLGINASPALVWQTRLNKMYWQGEIKLFSRLKLEYVSDRYADYFYGVNEQFQTQERTAYQAKGGKAGYRFSQNIRWQKDNQIVTLFLAYADISNASYVKSPLVKTHTHLFGGGAYFWLF